MAAAMLTEPTVGGEKERDTPLQYGQEWKEDFLSANISECGVWGGVRRVGGRGGR